MLVLTPKVPSRRNIEIYYAVNARQRRQVEVAADEKISQSRVSRICAEVKHWIALGKPGQCQSVTAQAFIAADLWNERLAFYEQQALAAFAATCPATDAHVEAAKAKPPRPDARLLKQAVDCAREQFALSTVLAKAHQEVHDRSRDDGLYEEEMAVSRVQATCERASELHHELSRRGVRLPPLPKLDLDAIELFARNRLRREQPREIETKNYLPPEWLAVVSAVEQAPLCYAGQEVVPATAETHASSSPPVAPSVAPPPASEAAANVQAYGEDYLEAAEPEEAIITATATRVAEPTSQPALRDQRVDYTVLARRHKSQSQQPPIRWFRMT